MNSNTNLIQGNALTELQKLKSETVDCCITSPPYWALRDYKTDGQLGLEKTIDEYINKLVAIFTEVKRVLKKTGSAWVVIGDTYANNGGKQQPQRDGPNGSGIQRNTRSQPYRLAGVLEHRPKSYNIPEKSLCMIPERFSIAMIDSGWILRNKIIWYKPNCMPSSAKDRFTVDWEYVYFFVKSQKYYFETQYVPSDLTSGWAKQRARGINNNNNTNRKKQKDSGRKDGMWFWPQAEMRPNPLGRIKRCVWKISTKPFSGAHFAVFPPQLIEPMIKAGCPQYICCKCGKAREKIMEFTGERIKMGWTEATKYGDRDKTNHHAWKEDNKPGILTKQVKQYRDNGLSDCGCGVGWNAGIVLDPFMGSGTTGMVALQNARDFIGIELNPQYIELARKRLEPWLKQERLVLA